MDDRYEVVVVGGGPAGLSAAVALARSRRSMLVIDAGSPRNAPAGHVHNYLARESTPPAELLAAGRTEVAHYGGELRDARVTSAKADGDGFRVELDDGSSVRGRRLLLATGLTDELPDVPGLAERWGRDVLHCAYCHGWEVRDQAIGVLATGPMAVHQAQLFRQLSSDVTLFLHTAPELSEEDRRGLDARRVAVVEGEVTGLEVTDDRLTGVRLSSGAVVPREALVVAPRFTAQADLARDLGLEPEELVVNGYVVGSSVPSEPTGATTVPGVWVAGNVADLQAQVITSAAAGLKVGAQINADLVAEDTRQAVAAYSGHG